MRFEGRTIQKGPSWLDREVSSQNRLYYGDNFDIMLKRMGKDSVDLIYLDPPFNSEKNYSIVYSKERKTSVPEQVKAFSDTWTLDAQREEMARAMPLLMRDHGIDSAYIELWKVWMHALRYSQPKLLAYLVYMVQRLIMMKSVLRPTGSIYFHCDPTASHYLKVMMDAIFGHENFQNEIVWKRTSSHNRARRWGDIHDIILFYSKTRHYVWNNATQDMDASYVDEKYKFRDDIGFYRWVDATAPGLRAGSSGQEWQGFNPGHLDRHWAVSSKLLAILEEAGFHVPPTLEGQLDALQAHGFMRFATARNGGRGKPELKRYLPEGQPLQDIILDISPLNSQSKERLGYPTQKPTALIDRIITASSNEGDVIFDPFCGCGTTLFSAQRLNRRWIGCDIAILPIQIASRTLQQRFGLQEGSDFVLVGIPESYEEAERFAQSSPEQYSHWIIEFIGGLPVSKSVGDLFDGFIFDRQTSGTGAFPLVVKSTLRKPDIDRLRSLCAHAAFPDGLGIITVSPPSQAALAELAQLVCRPGGSTAEIQVLSLRQIIDLNQRFRLPSATGHRYQSAAEPSFI